MTAGRTNANDSTKSHHWGTPKVYVDAVRKVLGNIDLDPCSNKYSIVGADVEYVLPTDGLKETWNFQKIYVNPPYGRDPSRGTTIKDWLRKCYLAYENGSEVIALVPVATNTSHWKEYVWPSAACIAFLKDTRLRFLENGVSKPKGASMACSMIYWGQRSVEFMEVFQTYGNLAIPTFLKEGVG